MNMFKSVLMVSLLAIAANVSAQIVHVPDFPTQKLNTESAASEAVVNEQMYRDWETDRKSTRLNSSHSAKSRMPSSA